MDSSSQERQEDEPLPLINCSSCQAQISWRAPRCTSCNSDTPSQITLNRAQLDVLTRSQLHIILKSCSAASFSIHRSVLDSCSSTSAAAASASSQQQSHTSTSTSSSQQPRHPWETMALQQSAGMTNSTHSFDILGGNKEATTATGETSAEQQPDAKRPKIGQNAIDGAKSSTPAPGKKGTAETGRTKQYSHVPPAHAPVSAAVDTSAMPTSTSTDKPTRPVQLPASGTDTNSGHASISSDTPTPSNKNPEIPGRLTAAPEEAHADDSDDGDDGDGDDDSEVIIIKDDSDSDCPEGIDAGVFHALPREFQLEIVNDYKESEAASSSSAEATDSPPSTATTSACGTVRRRAKARALPREVAALRDRNHPGLHDQAPNVALAATVAGEVVYDASASGRSSLRRSAAASTSCRVIRRDWFAPGAGNSGLDAGGRSDRSYVLDQTPVLYTNRPMVPPLLQRIARQLLQEITLQFEGDDAPEQICSQAGTDSERSPMFESCERVFPGYFKGHLENEVSNRMSNSLPSGFQVKELAPQKGMAFVNTRYGQCHTHYDRDSSVLLLISGSKHVMIAPLSSTTTTRTTSTAESNSANYEDVDPFADASNAYEWELVDMAPGDALYIPKDYLHCIQSTNDAVALSLQVEPYRVDERMKESQDLAFALQQSAADHAAASGSPGAAAGSPDSADGGNTDTADNADDHSPSKDDNGKKKEVASMNSAVVAQVDSARPTENAETSQLVNSKGANGNVTSKAIKRETDQYGDGRLVSRKKRKQHICGICERRGFGDNEMWVLYLKETVKTQERAALPRVPIAIGKHLLCMECRPRNGAGSVSLSEDIVYPKGGVGPIIAKEDFRNHGMKKTDLDKYEFVCASIIDYKKWALNEGQSLYGKAGQDYDASFECKIMAS